MYLENTTFQPVMKSLGISLYVYLNNAIYIHLKTFLMQSINLNSTKLKQNASRCINKTIMTKQH